MIGKYWSSICDDVGTCSVGCFGGQTCDQPGEVRPILNLRIELEPRSGGPAVTIAEDVDADADIQFRTLVTIPTDLAPGAYEVVARNDAGEEAVGPTIRVVQAA